MCLLAMCMSYLKKCLDLLPFFWLGSLFFCYWAAWTFCIFWRLILCQLLHLPFSPILRVVFSSSSLFSLLWQKILSLIRPHLFIFVFSFHYSQRWIKENLGCDLCQRMFCLCFTLKSVVVSGLTFRSLIYFEFIFVCDVRKCSNFILLYLHIAEKFSHHHL